MILEIFEKFSIFTHQETKYGPFIKYSTNEYWVKSNLEIDIWQEIFENNFKSRDNKYKFFCSDVGTVIYSSYKLEEGKIYFEVEQSNPYSTDKLATITKIDNLHVQYYSNTNEENILLDIYKDLNTNEIYAIFSNYFSDCCEKEKRKAILAAFINKVGVFPKLVIKQD